MTSPLEAGAPESSEKRDPIASAEARYSRIVKARDRLETDSMEAVAGADRLEFALIETTRTEANLGLLLRGLSRLTAGVTAARESNAALLGELEAVRELLGRSHEQELALRHKVRLLEQSLDTARREAALERAYLIDQEDAFLVELLDDHEREIARLRTELDRARSRPLGDTEPPPTEPERSVDVRESGTVEALRSEAPAADVPSDSAPTSPPGAPAIEEQSRLQTIPCPKPASPVDTPRVSVGAVKLQTIRIPLPLKEGGEAPASPEELHGGATDPPKESHRPSARYSLRGDEIVEERVEVSRFTILPPSER